MKDKREAIEARVFFVTTGILMTLFVAWVVYAFIDLGAAIGLLFIIAAILIGVFLMILAAAWVADEIGDVVSHCCGG